MAAAVGLALGASAALPPALLRLRPDEASILALQVLLDRAGFSPNTLDGAYGRKTQVALATWCAAHDLPPPAAVRPALLLATYFPEAAVPFTTVTVTEADLRALVKIPAASADKARLPAMGYETLQEMYAERGHLSEPMLRRLNPGLAWPNPSVGSVVTLPDFSGDPLVPANPHVAQARIASLRVSLARYEITAFDAEGRFVALFPCSIAADKAKRPAAGEIRVTCVVPDPNYTYTPDVVPPGVRAERQIYPPGPNNPVGVAWLGLSLPGYGIHGTPHPARIGRAESHGCFRLANWNARRLSRLCEPGVPVVIEE